MQIFPSREEFFRIAEVNNVVPVWAQVLADLDTPVSAYLKLVGQGPGFLLESVEHGERWSRYSFVGSKPVATLVARNQEIKVTGSIPNSVPLESGMLAAMEALLAVYQAPLNPQLPPLQGGLMGFLGYDAVREIEDLPNVPPEDRDLPDAVISIIGSLAAFDHWKQCCYMIESVPVAGLTKDELEVVYTTAVNRVRSGISDLSKPLEQIPVSPPRIEDSLQVSSSLPIGKFKEQVRKAKEYIRMGDIFQIVLSQRFDLQLEADPFDVYRVLRQVNPSPYMYYLKHEEVSIVGSSPEPLVQVRNKQVISRPIAGTRRRGSNDVDDRRLASELSEDPKERAEHVMLVDLARNDLGRVCEFGSMKVDEFMTLERFSHVMHLTSQVSGTLRTECGPIDVLRATFPAGTVSGAPKVRAMEIIDELETMKRGPYAGVVGYVDFSGNLDTAIAIRTMFVGQEFASLQAGAGIVIDSDPDEEDLECKNKAAAFLAAIPAARRMLKKSRGPAK